MARPSLAGEGAEDVFQKAGARAAAGHAKRAERGEGKRQNGLPAGP